MVARLPREQKCCRREMMTENALYKTLGIMDLVFVHTDLASPNASPDRGSFELYSGMGTLKRVPQPSMVGFPSSNEEVQNSANHPVS